MLDVEGGASGHQLLKPHPCDEQTAGEIEMLQQRESSTLRQTPATNTHSEPNSPIGFVFTEVSKLCSVPQAEIRDLIASGQAEEPECATGS